MPTALLRIGTKFRGEVVVRASYSLCVLTPAPQNWGFIGVRLYWGGAGASQKQPASSVKGEAGQRAMAA